jgi:hypothetical protein
MKVLFANLQLNKLQDVFHQFMESHAYKQENIVIYIYENYSCHNNLNNKEMMKLLIINLCIRHQFYFLSFVVILLLF